MSSCIVIAHGPYYLGLEKILPESYPANFGELAVSQFSHLHLHIKTLFSGVRFLCFSVL